MSFPSHGELAELWMNTGRDLTVDNLKFPNSPTSVLKRLREAFIIDAVTEKRLSAVVGLRNDLSHHESSTVVPPSTSTIHMAAELINILFDSLPHTPWSRMSGLMSYERWMAPADPAHLPVDLLRPYPADGMTVWKVSSAVGNVKNDEPGLIVPVWISFR
jgi:hypothetical protein